MMDQESAAMSWGHASMRGWTAPILVLPEEIRAALDGFRLCGRRIESMTLMGHSYSMDDMLEYIEEEDMYTVPSIDPDYLFDRAAEVDEPLWMMFDDGDVWEILTPEEMRFRMSMNAIASEIRAKRGTANVDANVLFSPCLGQRIIDVEVHTFMSNLATAFGDEFTEPPYERERVAGITLRLENGIGLCIEGWLDFCEVECIDAQGKRLPVRFAELRPGLWDWDDRRIAWEDVHSDPRIGFTATSPTLWVGEQGAAQAEEPYMTLFSSGRPELKLYISAEDMGVLDRCISAAQGERFDEYGEYQFSRTEWMQLLAEGMRLLPRLTPAEWDEVTVARAERPQSIAQLQEEYRLQLTELRTWSESVLAEGDSLMMWGF